MNQHYVPRSYLKHFATPKGRGYFVDVYDKKEDRYFNCNIKNICSEIDFYTLAENNPISSDRMVIEKIYASGFEPMYLRAYNILTNHTIHHINDLQRIEILLGLFQLYMRNPSWINRSINAHITEICRLYREAKFNGKKGITYLNEDFSFRDWTEEAIVKHISDMVIHTFKENHVNGIRDLGDFHEYAKFEVAIIKPGDDSNFITGDNPMVMSDFLGNDDHPLQRSKEFVVALSPKISVRILHDNKKSVNRIYRHYMPNGSVSIQNNTVAENCSRFVIGKKEQFSKDAEIAKNILSDTSLERKIDLMRQVLRVVEVTDENRDALNITRVYLEKYDRQGYLSEEDESTLVEFIMNQGKRAIEKRLS